ncbi:unnamed protein product [Alternaria burnsii]|nr:unnamed protein product [Alternaria burnsii]
MEVFLVPVRARWQLKMELRQKTAVLVVFEWVLCGSLDWLERRACARSIQCDGGWLLWIVLSSHAYGTMGLYLAGEPNDTGLYGGLGRTDDAPRVPRWVRSCPRLTNVWPRVVSSKEKKRQRGGGTEAGRQRGVDGVVHLRWSLIHGYSSSLGPPERRRQPQLPKERT